jgi:tetratricopeptide (TPR) repeat protein
MSQNAFTPSEDLQQFQEIVEALFQATFYENVVNVSLNALESSMSIDNVDRAMLVGLAAGYLIDAGKRLHDEEAIRKGTKFLETHYDSLRRFLSQPHLEYNIGNGKTGLFDLSRRQRDFRYVPKKMRSLAEIKNHYWKAYKLQSPSERRKWPELLTNLGQTLSTSGRVIEAIQFYDLVLRDHPNHPNANVSRAYDLLWLNSIAGNYSINQIWQAFSNLKLASENKDAHPDDRQKWGLQAEDLLKQLHDRGHSTDKISHDLDITAQERLQHSPYRRWCLDNFLTLSEHAIYCDCVGARRDDLSIVPTTGIVGGDYIERMEHAVNRFKAEYGWARLQLYQSNRNEWNVHEEEITYSELFEQEAIGMKSEMLRNSMRIAFGILDKITNSLCELFQVAEQHEIVNFLSFWDPKKERWNQIGDMENVGLIGLLSIASDLFQKSGGEWSMLKEWRDLLEHRLLALTYGISDYDILKIYEGGRVAVRIPLDEFQDSCLRLLQLVRSAIFMFVYCVRVKANKEHDPDAITLPITMLKKNDFDL